MAASFGEEVGYVKREEATEEQLSVPGKMLGVNPQLVQQNVFVDVCKYDVVRRVQLNLPDSALLNANIATTIYLDVLISVFNTPVVNVESIDCCCPEV